MIRPGKIIKASTPETLEEMGKKIVDTEPRIPVNMRLKQSIVKKLAEKSLEYGYPKQEIIDKALEVFLK